MLSPSSGYNARSLLPELALGYDWIYDRFSGGQRAAFQALLETLADWVWPETNPTRVNGWGVTGGQDNFYHGFMFTWTVGLALYGDSSKAAGYINRGLARFTDVVRPNLLDTYAAGGFMPDGTNYGTGAAQHILMYLLAHQTATGQALLEIDWTRDLGLAYLYLTTPSLDRMYLWGDQPRVATAPLSDYHRASMLMLLSVLVDPYRGYVKHWLDTVTPAPMEFDWHQWLEFLFYRPDVAAVDYTAALSKGYYAPGAGWSTSRSGWASRTFTWGWWPGRSRTGTGTWRRTGS